MKTITVPEHSKLINYLLEQARQQNLILQSADGEQFVLAKIMDRPVATVEENINAHVFEIGEEEDFEEEIILTRQNLALMSFLDERSAHVKPGAGISIEEIRQHLDE
ncbi:MAG: hypothetical protein F6K65_16775 [Moorea sp. SIO3C2]|nr:hypothetical protein [Moorena sp. SIO3C2]